MPEWIGTLIFFLAIWFSAAKINEDIGQHGVLGYVVLLIVTFVYAAAVGVAYV